MSCWPSPVFTKQYIYITFIQTLMRVYAQLWKKHFLLQTRLEFFRITMSDKLELLIIKRKAFANCKKCFHKRDTVLYKIFCVTSVYRFKEGTERVLDGRVVWVPQLELFQSRISVKAISRRRVEGSATV